ncbi:MAG TPA: hypothetical protein VF379_00665 [Gaiellaceae bacterium]
MNRTRRPLDILRASHGQTATEYAVILGFLVAVVLVVIPFFGATVLNLFTEFNRAFGG